MKLRLSLPAIFLLFISQNAVAATLSDVSSSPYEQAILSLADLGIVEGYSDDTFRPTRTVNRAEFLKMLMDAAYPDAAPKDLRCFRDLDVQTPQWYARTVCAAAELGIVNGYDDGYFRPEQTVNLAEALKMATRTFGIVSVTTGGAWYEQYIAQARERSILLHLLKNPDHHLTREETASVIFELMMETQDEETTDVLGMCGNGVREQSEQCDDGNLQDGDGCSSICVIVPEPVRRAILNIDQQASGTITTVAKGQKGINLLKFTAVAGRQDALLTSLVFEPSVGSLLYARNYELLMDRDGNGSYETVAQQSGTVQGGRLLFDRMIGGGVKLPENLIVPFVLRADLASNAGPMSLGVRFAVTLPDFVEAAGHTDGLELEGIETDNICTAGNCFIRVNTKSATELALTDRGNLFVTEDTMTVRSSMLLGSAISSPLLRLRLHAEGEGIDLRVLRIDGVASSIDALLLYKLAPGETFSPTMTPLAQASHGQCPTQAATRFCATLPSRTFVVSPDEDAVIVITARMKSDALGAVSGQPVSLSISAASDQNGKAIDATGITSTKDLVQNDGDSVAEGEIVIGASSVQPNVKITGKTGDTSLASIASVVRDGVAQSSFIPVGFSRVGGFKISAHPHGNNFHGSNDVVLQSLAFVVNAQNVLIDPLSFRLSTSLNPEAQLACSASGSTGTFDVTCTDIDSSAVQSRIGQGLAVTYFLSANVTNTQVSGGSSVLHVTLPTLGQRGTTNSIIWSDESTTFTWVDTVETSVGGTIFR